MRLRRGEAFAEEVDADEDVVLALAEGRGGDGCARGVHVTAADPDFGVVVGGVFGHVLGERGDEEALVVGRAVPDLGEEVVDLVFAGADFYLGVNEAGGADDLFYDDASSVGELVSVNWAAELIAASTSPCRASWKRASACSRQIESAREVASEKPTSHS